MTINSTEKLLKLATTQTKPEKELVQVIEFGLNKTQKSAYKSKTTEQVDKTNYEIKLKRG